MNRPAKKRPPPSLKVIAQEVAEKIHFGHWQNDQTTREIATAPDLLTAAWRLTRLIDDAKVGLDAVLARMAPAPRKRRRAGGR